MGSSCSRINQAKDIFTNPSAREVYTRDFEETAPEFAIWKKEFENALFDSVAIALPYSETGNFSAEAFPVYSYELTLDQGEQLQVVVKTDSTDALVFVDLYEQKEDPLPIFEHIKSSKYSAGNLQQEITAPGVYKLLIQPEIAANTPFEIQIYKQPVYTFPVAAKGNSAVQSFWGASRDAGRRSHEGIDIFAARGTPVVAATEGRISSTGNKGLGGKQVWLRDRKRGNSLYYAHLDSIIATPGMKVSRGDTLGLVGNSGNARTTAPHLHFGIYKGYGGAQNPLPYVYQTEKPEASTSSEMENSRFLISTATANLRKGPSTKAMIAGRSNPRDTLMLLGKTENWYHARLKDQNVFIHESLAQPLL